MVSNKDLQNIANILRRDSLISTTEAGSGHPTSCLSCAEILSSLFFSEMSYDISNPKNPDNDEFILSKGHAAPILYSALFRSGCIDIPLTTLRKINSPLEGHPMPQSMPWIKVASGSLGQGLSIGLGMALASKLQKRKYRVYVLLGDSELAEGSNYEALQLASHYSVSNLCAIVDINRLGQTGETMLGHSISVYKKRFQSFGWNVFEVNGHSISELLGALGKARNSKGPSVILAKTIKGKGISFLENKNGWHGKTLSKEDLQKALKEIKVQKMPRVKIISPKELPVHLRRPQHLLFTPYLSGDLIATREAYGKALANLAKLDPTVISLDAEVSNSTFSQDVKLAFPEQYIETYIAEQNLIGLSLGLSKKGLNVFASTFGAFLTRAHDQIRMAALSNANFTVCGSHCGVSLGEDGASQMALDDISMFRAFPNSVILYPSDAVSTEKLVYLSSKIHGLKYIRTTRPQTQVIYNLNEIFTIGDFKVLRESKEDSVVLVGAGITLHEALKAHHYLRHEGVKTAVVDLYCIKPFDSKKFIDFVRKHGNKIVIAEDHFKEGGIGEMLSSELNGSFIKISHLCVNEIPHSGNKEELLDRYKIDHKSIIGAVKRII